LIGLGSIANAARKGSDSNLADAEMDIHLSENSLEGGSNRRNGMSSKTIKTASGYFELDVPRDRNSSFEPQLVKKRQTILNDELDSNVLALYGLGTSYRDIPDIYRICMVLRSLQHCSMNRN